MKKLAALLLTALLMVTTAVSAFAETESKDIWIDADVAVSAGQVTVSVETNGKATDGLLTVTYNSKSLSCKEEDVTFASGVDMFSVNAAEEGIVKISWLAGEPVPAGTLLEIGFTVKSEYKEGDVALGGEAFDQDGGALTVGDDVPGPEESTTESETEAPETQTTESDVTEPNTESTPGTGDATHFGGYILLICIGAAGCAAAIWTQRRSRERRGTK